VKLATHKAHTIAHSISQYTVDAFVVTVVVDTKKSCLSLLFPIVVVANALHQVFAEYSLNLIYALSVQSIFVNVVGISIRHLKVYNVDDFNATLL
jgi:hypothetical protein